MFKDKFFKAVMILILALLVLNLLKEKSSLPLLNEEARAQSTAENPQSIRIQDIYEITCSNDGKYVYIVGDYSDKKEKVFNRRCVYRSNNFGDPGSWELVAQQKVNNY